MAQCFGAPGRTYSYQDCHYYCNWTTCGAKSFRECPHWPSPLTRRWICVCCILPCKSVSQQPCSSTCAKENTHILFGKLIMYADFGKVLVMDVRVILQIIEAFVGRCSSLISISCVAYKLNFLYPLVVHVWRLCLNLNEEQPISVHLRTKLNLAPLGMPKWFWPSMQRYRMFIVQTNLHDTSKHTPKTYWRWKVLYAK